MTLSEVEENFAKWRANRKNKQEKIPDELMQQVRSLCSSYLPSTLCRILKLSGAKLKQATQGDGFAIFDPILTTELTSTHQAQSQAETAPCEIRLERLGTCISVKVPIGAFDMVLTRLAGYLPC